MRHVVVLGGVGGGSLVHAAVLLRPRASSWAHTAWQAAGSDWSAPLPEHYATAERMLRVVRNPFGGQ